MDWCSAGVWLLKTNRNILHIKQVYREQLLIDLNLPLSLNFCLFPLSLPLLVSLPLPPLSLPLSLPPPSSLSLPLSLSLTLSSTFCLCLFFFFSISLSLSISLSISIYQSIHLSPSPPRLPLPHSLYLGPFIRQFRHHEPLSFLLIWSGFLCIEKRTETIDN